MIPLKLIFSIWGIILSFWAYIHYFYSIFKKQTKPHVYTWFIFSLLMISSFSIQSTYNGGIGTVVIFVELIGSIITFLLALKFGEKQITRLDTVFMTLALLSLVLWFLFKLPTISIILIMCVDIFALLPTYRKCFYKPHEETIVMYLVSVLIFSFSLLGMENYTFLTVWHQSEIILFDGMLVLFILLRRYQLKQKSL